MLGGVLVGFSLTAYFIYDEYDVTNFFDKFDFYDVRSGKNVNIAYHNSAKFDSSHAIQHMVSLNMSTNRPHLIMVSSGTNQKSFSERTRIKLQSAANQAARAFASKVRPPMEQRTAFL